MVQLAPQRRMGEALSDREVTTIASICNRLGRMFGLTDREGIQQDFAIVQAHCPLDLDALAAAPDNTFVDELMTILDATDRRTGSLKGSFRSRFMVDTGIARLL